jgi:hypothetical protein
MQPHVINAVEGSRQMEQRQNGQNSRVTGQQDPKVPSQQRFSLSDAACKLTETSATIYFYSQDRNKLLRDETFQAPAGLDSTDMFQIGRCDLGQAAPM